MKLDPKTAGMNPHRMRIDAKGTLFVTLNAFGRVLMWDTAVPEGLRRRRGGGAVGSESDSPSVSASLRAK